MCVYVWRGGGRGGGEKNTKVCQLDRRVGCEKDVVSFYITVDDTAAMEISESRQHPRYDCADVLLLKCFVRLRHTNSIWFPEQGTNGMNLHSARSTSPPIWRAVTGRR